MKKTLLSAALMAGFGIAALAPQAANASDGTITFNGKVVANTCTFKVNGSNAGVVTLPVVFYTALSTAGSTTGATAFNIDVTGCDSNLTSVQEKFSGSNINTDGNLTNTGTAGTAVEVQLTDNSGNAINLNTNANSPVGTLSGGSTTIPLKAEYYAPAALTSTNVGTVATSVTYTSQYL